MIPCDAIIDAGRLDTLRSETSPTRAKSYEKLKKNHFNKKVTCKTKKLYILLPFLLITILIAVSIYCCFIKYRAKQNVLPYHNTSKLKKLTLKVYSKMKSNDELKDIDIKNRTCYYIDDIIKIDNFDFPFFIILFFCF